MTDSEAMALGERWIAAGGGWRPGMGDGAGGVAGTEGWPDLRDPATRGAALDVVRGRWGEPLAQVTPWFRWDEALGRNVIGSGWRACINDAADHAFSGATEGEALVAALEAAPR